MIIEQVQKKNTSENIKKNKQGRLKISLSLFKTYIFYRYLPVFNNYYIVIYIDVFIL